VPTDPLAAYTSLQATFAQDVKGVANQTQLGDIYRACARFLAKLERVELRSLVPEKQYFAFSNGKKLSRAVNKSLFTTDAAHWKVFCERLGRKDWQGLDVLQTTRIVYSVAVAFFCFVDLTKEGDQKTPGTFFEYLIGHLFAWRLGINPTTRLPVLNLDMETTLPTDYIFNLGKGRAKFHLPIKVSTRERVIQVWAHQRVLDGVYGTGRFLGTPVILTETKTDKAKREVIEICLPDQWRIYQMHIAQLKRIYYLDVPVTYERLNAVFPPLNVKPFGLFFAEADTLSA
jgi:hypothetical protein